MNELAINRMKFQSAPARERAIESNPGSPFIHLFQSAPARERAIFDFDLPIPDFRVSIRARS